MLAADIGQVPMDCFGASDAVRARIVDIGAAAMLALEDGKHVAQLQFRRHAPILRSPSSIWHPDYWGDFGTTQPVLPTNTLGLFCFHVGQLTDGTERAPAYQGRGLGLAMLDQTLQWANARGFEAVVAKCTPANPAVMRFMGGLPRRAYEERGFSYVAGWVEPELHRALIERSLVPASSPPEEVATVGMVVRWR